MSISAQEIHRLFNYEPTSGSVTWAVTERGRRKKGIPAGSLSKGYMQVGVRGKVVQHHKIAYACMTGHLPLNEIDHINGKKNDNRWVNLRPANRCQQNANRVMPLGESGYRGVVKKPSGKFEARIRSQDKIHYIGSFETGYLAAQAFDRMAILLHGEFAVLNFTPPL